jgi:hypothetical protein
MIHAAGIAWMHSFAKNMADCERTSAMQACSNHYLGWYDQASW